MFVLPVKRWRLKCKNQPFPGFAGSGSAGTIVANIDTDIIRRNRRIFENYCQRRRQNAYDLNAEKASVAFEIIPALLCLNDPSLPGYVPEAEKACGIYGIGTSRKLQKIIRNYFADTGRRRISFQRFLIQRPIIDALFLMGSIGTVAQKNRSD